MKIDRSRLKKSTSEVPAECQALIDKLRSCTQNELLDELKAIDAWTFGKCELYHWIDILDIFDSILEEGARQISPNNWIINCDLQENEQVKVLLLWILRFTTLLIEHSFSRHLYNSMEHLIALLASCDMNVVLAVLNLLYMFSKRSNFLQRINNEKRVALIQRLTYLAENWGARHGYSLSNCVANKPIQEYPPETTTLHYEYYAEVTDITQTVSGKNKSYSVAPVVIHIEKLHTLNKTPAEIMNDIVLRYPPPRDKQVLMMLFTYIRSAVNFPNYPVRLLCVQARLQALSVLAYSNALAECAHTLLYEGLVEELRNVLHIAVDDQVEIRASAVRTLTSIIHLDRNPHFPKKSGSRLSMIIDVTGASSYHGFLPTLTRSCIYDLIRGDSKYEYFPPYEFRVEKYSLPLATSLFSFLYHLASYEAGGEALVSCGMMDSLLQVIDWPGHELEHITFVTRAVRVIDLITNIEMQGFQARGGLTSFINRLEMEVNICRKEQPFEIPTADSSPPDDEEMRPPEDERPPVLEEMDVEPAASRESGVNPPSLPEGAHPPHSDAGGESSILRRQKEYDAAKTGKMCLPQRAALLKSMLNFLKKAIQDTSFADSIRHIMDGSLPSSLRHIISNAEYYGPSLFLLATDVVTVYVFQEPSLLSSLQDNGLTHVVLEALLVKDVPATREVLGSLPNVFSALCLNDRGLAQFIVCNPFESLFKVLLSPVYLGAMRRRRTTDPIGDTASNLGNAMDELMRHQPTLKSSATSAIIKLLEELCELGRDPKYVCWRAQNRMDVSPTPAPRPSTSNEGGSSDEEEEDEEEASTSSHTQREETTTETTNLSERQPVALLDYIINVMKFVDAILSNNSTDDHCREFVAQKGLPPLMSILGLPNLPVDYPVTAAAQAVATVCKSILNLSHEPQVLKIGLMQLSVVLDSLRPLHCPIEEPGSSVLLHELATAPNLETAFSTASATPLLHAMSAAHGYVVMFVHVCRTGQTEIRSLSISHWASELGLSVLRGLARLYSSLVWESTLLLALCSDDIIPADSRFGKEDLEKLLPPELRSDDAPWRSTPNEAGSSSTSVEAMNTDDDIQVIVEECGYKTKEGSRQLPSAIQLKYIRPLLGASSRLGRALAELFGLLVKLCVGSPMRQRRGQQLTTSTPLVPSPPARAVAGALTDLLVDGLNWKLLPSTRITKFKFTFLICSVGFTSPMLGDEKKCAYHLMLQKFGSLGFTAFLDTFYWAISGGHKFDAYNGLEHPDLPEGTGEFLDAWLLLLEKLVNPKNVLESPHTISVKHGIIYKPFDAVSYLHKIHQRAFVAVGHLWGKKPLKHYGPRMSDTMMAIFKHILRGEKIWLEHCRKNKDRAAQPGEGSSASSSTTQNVSGDSSTSGSTTTRRPVDLDTPEPEVNQEALNQLMDMGFSRDHCVEALFHTSSVEQATEYLLTYPLTHNRPAHHSSMDVDLTEEDQMSRAISLSLGEKISSDSENKETQKQSLEPGMELDESLLIDKFTEHVLKDCLQLMDEIPDTVFRACELLVAVAKRNGKAWCLEMLNDLTFEIATRIYYMIGIMESPRVKPSEVVTELVESDAAIKAAVRIHLFTLLFEGPQEMRLACIEVVAQTCINEGCSQLLIKAQKVLAAHGQPVTPKWMAPLILLIDLFEKVAVITHRKNEMLKVTNNVWRWFDLTSGKWTAYSVSNNKIINEAYWNGESAVRLNCGRRRYVIHFNYMIQTNEESGSRRPVTMSLVCREKTEGKDYPPRSEKKDDKEPDKMDTDASEEDEQRKKFKKMNSVARDVQEALVRACVGILALPANTDTLHAAMRLCLRLSRGYENARTFAKLGGVGYLLNLTKASSFGGFQELATMLIRHAIEEPVTLRHAMEKVIRSRTLPNIPPPYKEILYLMRNTSSCVCRDPNAYLEVACDILRCDLNLLPKRSEEDDPRLLVKAQPSRWNTALVMQEDAAVQVISDLLNALTRVVLCSEKADEPEPDKEKPPTKKNVYCSYNVLPVHNTLMHRYPGDPLLPDAIEDREQVRMFHQNNDTSNNSQKTSKDEEGEHSVQAPQRNDGEKSGPLMPKSSILKILADAVRSYSACAKLIIDHTYTAGMSELVIEDCTALAFILDKLIPVNENQYDRECQSTARMLISAIASCNHTPEAQTTLVCELKAALLRSLAMPESVEKHTRIANLSAIILHTIENCPPLVNQPQTPSMKLHQYSNNVNNIVKVMLRKGLLTDLARIAHYMDLSSPHVVNSINAVLKPLETLSRIVNQPSTTPPSKAGKAKPQVHANGSAEHTGTTTSEATHAQGEETVEDAENTDHDISGTAESLEPTSESQVQEDVVDDAVLDDVMDQLLERDGVGSNEENILNASFTVEPEPQSNRMETDDVHTPPIRNQSSLPYGNEDDDTQDVDRVQSSDSDSGSNPSDDPDEEVNNVDDDDDDDDEEEEDEEGDDNEDEEGGSGYDEDGLEFFESDDGLFRIPGLDRENEDILMIQYSDPDLSGPGPHVPWNSNSFPIPLGIFEDPGNGNEATAVNRLTPNHPLLTARHPSDTNNLTGPRAQRGNRPRRYQYLQLNGRSPNPPVILQRLLGPGNHDLSITTNQAGYRDATRVVVMDNGMGLFANTNSEEEQIDFVDQSGYLFGPSLTATLGNIPTALWWWCEEGKLLDGDSQPDCVVANASKVIEVLEITKAEEIALRRERFRKRMEEEESKKRKEEKKISTEGDTEVASTSSGQPARRSSIATGNTDVASATESLAESIVESVLRPTLQSQPPPVDGPVFSELTTGLLCSLSEILPSVTAPQNPLPRTSAEQTMQSDGAAPAAGATTAPAPASAAPPAGAAAATVTPPPTTTTTTTTTAATTAVAASVTTTTTTAAAAVAATTTTTTATAAAVPASVTSATVAMAAAPPPPPPPVDGEPELPEGVDPSFLAALPDEVREEVIAEQLRLQRLRQRAVQQSSETAPTSVTEVNPEFLAALPPAIQEEVLAQQRMEQQRQAAATANPNDPVDAAAFFQNLQPSLRQAILTDMEDSQISVLPPDLAQEAQNLRREWEARNRQLMQERFFSHVSHNNSALSSILRNTGRVGSARYAIHAVPQRAQWNPWNTRPDPHPAMPLASHGLRLRGRQLLDHEALACLLVLLFLDEPKLNTARLHRVLRNLCYHGPTREWVIKALLSILDLCTEPKRDGRRKPQYNFFSTPQWLNVKMDTALGLRARVFNIGHQAGKRGNRSLETTGITVHKRAAPVIIRHTLEVLISLAKTFPGYFLPLKSKSNDKDACKDGGSKSRASTSAGPSGSKSSRNDLANFWDILLKLDSTTYSKKGKSVARSHCLPGPVCDDEHHTHSFESSPFGQLMKMLQKFPGYGPTLVDKMLRLLSLISIGLPEINPYLRHREHAEGKKSEERDESVPVSKEYVRKIMTQLELQTCSEEGLEDATALLLNLSNCPDPTKEIIYGVLINGAINTANFVSQLLRGVQMELDDVNSRWDQDPFDDKDNNDADENVISDSDEEYESSDNHDTNQSDSSEMKENNCESERMYNSYDDSGLQDENYETLQEDYDTLQDYEGEGEENENDNDNEDSGDGEYDYVDANDDTTGFGDVDSFGDEVDVYCDEDNGENGDNDDYNNGVGEEVNKEENVDNAGDNFNDGEEQDATTGELNKGIVPDRFTNGTVVVSAPVKVKGCYDVFMPSLNSLTKRTSTQAFFLRMLRVIVQIRESVRMSRRRRQENNDNTAGGTATSTTSTTLTTTTTTTAATATTTNAMTTTTTATTTPATAAATAVSQTTTSSLTTTTATTTAATTAATAAKTKDEEPVLPPLSQELEQIDHLWDTLSSVLTKLAETPDNHHAVMSLQPTVEAFFLVHSTTGEEQRSVYEGRLDPSLGAAHGTYPEAPLAPVSPLQPDADGSAGNNAQQSPVFQSSTWEQSSPPVTLNPDQQKFLKFAEKHRAVLNQILRQASTHLADGPFAVLVDHTRVLDFDVKRKYFRSELERMDEGIRREELAVHVRRSHVFEDSFRELHRRTIDEWKNRFYIVFEGEEGQDAGGLLREWYVIISREIFNPMYALFTTSPGDRVTYMINQSSHCNPNHLCYFKFVGRVIAKAIYDNKLLECYFTRSFYKHILGIHVKHTDMESEDYSFYQGLVYLMEHHVSDLGYDLTFSAEVQEFGVTDVRDLIPNGRNIPVTESNKMDYIRLVCQMKMTGAIRKQINAFLEGFYDIIPKRLISIFNEQELELLISGMPNVDIEDLKANTEYHKYQPNSLQIQWFWRALRGFDQADRAKFLQFVTGTSKVPLQGFAALEGMNGVQKFQIHRDDRSTDRLPSAHTCFNQLDLPVYETYDKLRTYLLKAIHECSEGFGFA
ncbi:hypothetical protein R5R35_008271 [Gryllus longicercus]|uniref:E3 ubiquitin-protein ligase HUWE1 n=1 Tax=Gryllus longicercus TaxID=2509291 RepID=A0AAN9VTR3_9ORTH